MRRYCQRVPLSTQKPLQSLRVFVCCSGSVTVSEKSFTVLPRVSAEEIAAHAMRELALAEQALLNYLYLPYPWRLPQ
jgi:hypothetical protein